MASYYMYDDGTKYEFDEDKNFIPNEDVIAMEKGDGWDDSKLISYGNSSSGSSSGSSSSSSSKRSSRSRSLKRRQLKENFERDLRLLEDEKEELGERLDLEVGEKSRQEYVNMMKNQQKIANHASAYGLSTGNSQSNRDNSKRAYDSALKRLQAEKAKELAAAQKRYEEKYDEYEFEYNQAKDRI